MMTVRDYVDTNGEFCPRCQYDHPEGDNPEFGDGEASARMHCPECGLRWIEGYQLVNYYLL